jgi:hypothetical protein
MTAWANGLHDVERDALLAAVRLYQAHLEGVCLTASDVEDVATNGGAHDSPTPEVFNRILAGLHVDCEEITR